MKFDMVELNSKKPGMLQNLLELAVNVIVIILLVYVVRTYLVSPFQVYGQSMCNTLNFIDDRCERGFGEYLIVNKAVYQNFFGFQVGLPQFGDIVVFRPHGDDEKEFYIKRILGVPGDEIRIRDGEVYLKAAGGSEFAELEELYLSDQNAGRTKPIPFARDRTYKVPEGQYFLLGDNRNESTDSRSCFTSQISTKCQEEVDHFLPAERIEGKAWVVLWPFSKMRTLP